MKFTKYIVIICLIVMTPFLVGMAASKDQDTKKSAASDRKSEEKAQVAPAVRDGQTSAMKISDKPVYRPPLRGAPAGRVGGGTRGVTERESFTLQVLVPDHAALTISDQPRLYWFISKAIAYPLELTIIEKKAIKPLIEKKLHFSGKPGIQSIHLADYNIRLKKNVQYKWFVTLMTDAEQRSRDILAGGIITCVEAPQALQEKLAAAGQTHAPSVYAEEGFWYDALGAISAMIDASPGNPELRKRRASLLEQVGLTEIAAFENL